MNRLDDLLKSYNRVAIAFSAGVDSTLLLYKAVDVLGAENVLAVTINSMLHPKSDLELAKKICVELGVQHIIYQVDEFENDEILKNNINRCYFCKKHLFKTLVHLARVQGIENVLDGTNYDDTLEYRPGLKALEELKVKSPFKDLAITKEEIRKSAKEMGIVVHKKPSSPCFATRLPYGSEITKEKIETIQKGEEILKNHGFLVCRLRHMGDSAKIEVERDNLPSLITNTALINEIKSLGFLFVTADLEGFRSGNMDKGIKRMQEGVK